MYTLTRGPSKLATQRRTGPTQQAVESSKLGELRGRLQAPAWPPASPAQKLVFNRVNGKRPQVLLQQISAPEECYTLAHEENVRFIYEAWQQVEQQLDGSRSGESACGPVQYVEKNPNPGLKTTKVGSKSSWRGGPGSPPWDLPLLGLSNTKLEHSGDRDNMSDGSWSKGCQHKLRTPVATEESPRREDLDFVPIDLEEWWAQQFLAKIQNCS